MSKKKIDSLDFPDPSIDVHSSLEDEIPRGLKDVSIMVVQGFTYQDILRLLFEISESEDATVYDHLNGLIAEASLRVGRVPEYFHLAINAFLRRTMRFLAFGPDAPRHVLSNSEDSAAGLNATFSGQVAALKDTADPHRRMSIKLVIGDMGLRSMAGLAPPSLQRSMSGSGVESERYRFLRSIVEYSYGTALTTAGMLRASRSTGFIQESLSPLFLHLDQAGEVLAYIFNKQKSSKPDEFLNTLRSSGNLGVDN